MRNVRKKRALLLIAAAVAVLTVAALLLVRAIFVTRNVVIEGTVSASDEEIIRAANLNLGGPIGRQFARRMCAKIWKKRANMRWTVWRFAAPARWCSMCASACGTQWFRWAGAFWSRIPTATSSKSATRFQENSGLYVRGLTCTDYSVGKRLDARRSSWRPCARCWRPCGRRTRENISPS